MNLMQMSISASVLIILVLIIRAFTLYKLPKMTFIVLWGMAVLRLLIPLSISFRFSIYTGLDAIKGLFVEKTSLPFTMGNTVMLNMAGMPDWGQPVSIDASITSLFTLIEITWFVGMCAFILFFVLTYNKFVGQFKMSLPLENEFLSRWLQENPLRRPVEIRQSDRIKTPLTYGVLHPVILLPKKTDWTDETKLRYILTHEFTHIRRFDTLTKLVLIAAVCVHWFNPLVWVMYVLANRDIELSCDERVLHTFGEPIKLAYAQALIELEETKGRFIPLVNNFKKNAIEERIVSIMKFRKTSFLGILCALVLVVGATSVFATSGNTDIYNIYNTPTPQTALIEDNIQIIHQHGKISRDASFGYGGISIIGDNISYVKFTSEIGELRFLNLGALKQETLVDQGKVQSSPMKLYILDSSHIQWGKEVIATGNKNSDTNSFDINWTPWYAIDIVEMNRYVDFASLPSDKITIEIHFNNGKIMTKDLKLFFKKDGSLVLEIVDN